MSICTILIANILCIVFIISHIFAPLWPQPEPSTETKFLFFKKKKNYICWSWINQNLECRNYSFRFPFEWIPVAPSDLPGILILIVHSKPNFCKPFKLKEQYLTFFNLKIYDFCIDVHVYILLNIPKCGCIYIISINTSLNIILLETNY